MSNFTPSEILTSEIDPTTYLAVGELVQAAAHQHGVTGPVPFEVLTERVAQHDDFFYMPQPAGVL